MVGVLHTKRRLSKSLSFEMKGSSGSFYRGDRVTYTDQSVVGS